MKLRSKLTWLSLTLAATLFVCGCGRQEEPSSYQTELLETAFNAASAFPVFPHIKNRSRAQTVVVEAALELNQPVRAKRYVDGIENWMRGAGYADLALYYAQHDAPGPAETLLKHAGEVVAETEGWEADRVKAKIAAARAYLGQADATGIEGVSADELGPVVRARASLCAPEAFDSHMATLAQQIAIDDFAVIRNALGGYAELYDRFYDDPNRRNAIDAAVEAAWDPVPILLRIEVLEELAEAALSHADQATALSLVDKAQASMDAVRWPADVGTQLVARLADLRARSGDIEGARAEAERALQLYESGKGAMANIYWAGMMRPIAEAYVAIGDSAKALEMYGRALEAGMENPNSRPRADDLVATCCSLALHECDPDAALMARIREIADGLGDPW